MRVLLKLILDCPPDAAWRAIRSPSVFTAVSAPLTTFTSLEADGFPTLWPAGDHPVHVATLGGIPIGEQIISISFPPARGDTRLVRDNGRGVSGPLALVTRWDHTMAVAPYPGGRTLYRDQLSFEAGPFTLLAWPLYWAFWQFRALQFRRLAPSWTA